MSEKETTAAQQDRLFMIGYIVCLSNCTSGGKWIETCHEEAWKALGAPNAVEVRKLGLSEFDRGTCNKLRKLVK